MNKFRGAHYLLCLALLSGVFGGLFGDRVVLAAQESSYGSFLLPPSQEQTTPPEESVEAFSNWPVLEGTRGSSFKFEITFNYRIKERRLFDLNLTVPSGWTGVIKTGYPEKEVSAFEPDPKSPTGNIYVEVAPVQGRLPEPGEYTFTFEIASGNLRDSVELKAVVIDPPPNYRLDMFTPTLRSDIQVKAGEDNHITVLLVNAETGTLENITFSSQKPEGWEVAFTPSEIESLEAWLSQEIDIVVTPPHNTEAGDYSLILKATSEKVDSKLELRVAVLTSTVWGGVGIGIAVGVIAGLIVWFRRLGKR